jgi:hypothetical protein
MKALLLLGVLANSSFAADPILPRITPQALARRQLATPMANLEKPTEGDAVVVRQEGQSILKQSLILHDGKNWTIIPKGSVVFLPAVLQARVDAKPAGNLLTYSEFLVQNRNWITTTEVTFDQAAGKEPLPVERVQFWSKQDKLVIAVHQSGPISVIVASKPQPITKR